MEYNAWLNDTKNTYFQKGSVEEVLRGQSGGVGEG